MLTNRLTKLTGVIADTRDRPGPKLQVVVFSPRRDTWDALSRFVARTTPDEDGAFSVAGLPPGDYYLAAIDRSRITGQGDGEWEDPELFESLIPTAKLVALFEGQQTTVTLNK